MIRWQWVHEHQHDGTHVAGLRAARPKRSGDAVHEYNNAHGHASYSSANWWVVAWTSYSVQLLSTKARLRFGRSMCSLCVGSGSRVCPVRG